MVDWDFDDAQICESGHVISAYHRTMPQFSSDFCETCGAPTLIECPSCNAAIRGEYLDSTGVSRYEAPSFCGKCGSPFPWTATAVEEWHALSDMIEGLSDQERERLNSVIDDLVRDTPRTERAALTLKTLAPKLGQEGWGAMKALLVSVATEAVKRSMGL